MGFFASSGILNRRGFFGGTTAAPFSPSDISGLQLWLDATTGLFDATSGGSAVTTDGSAVARWEDQSGNGRHFTQSTSNDRPILKTSIQNNKNVVRFDGSNDNMIGPDSLKINVPISMFAVVSKRGGTNYQTIYGNGILAAQEAGYGIFISATSDNNGAFASQYRNLAPASTNYFTATNPTTNQFFISSCLIDSSTNKVFFNNSAEDSVSHAITATPQGIVAIGARYSVSPVVTFFLNGDFAELLIYNSALSTANRESVRDYLNTKWSIY